MEVQRSIRDGCLVVSFTGHIDLSSVPQIQRTLRKDLSREPLALIGDLSGVQHLDPLCASVFATVPRFLPLYATVEDALDAAMDRPPYLHNELRLAPTPAEASAARAFVHEVLDYWKPALPDTTLAERAVLLANELVTNAVVHARTDLRLRLELRGDWLHIAVHDGSPRPLRMVTPDAEAEGGRGLWLVQRLARAWGVHRPPDGGKVVWCSLKL
jgi:anti-sigma regulatory factor (Ser/Thr protein kinase)